MTVSPPIEKFGYLPSRGRWLYSGWHEPAGAPRGGVLLCAPFGEERKCAYRQMVETARALAAAGWGVLRFDFGGTGESEGDHGAMTLADWQGDIAAALAVGRELGGERWVLLGARLGANLALACRAPAVVGRVLWEPLLAGGEYLEEMTRRRLIKAALGSGEAGGHEADGQEAAWARGEAVDFDGFGVGGGLADELRGLRLDEQLAACAGPLLVLHVSGASRPTGGWEAVAQALAARPGGVFRQLRERPFWGQLDHYVSANLTGETLAFCNGISG